MQDTKADMHARPAAPDYTTACVVMFGVNLGWVLVAIWAVWGLLAAAALAWGLDRLIRRMAASRGRNQRLGQSP